MYVIEEHSLKIANQAKTIYSDMQEDVINLYDRWQEEKEYEDFGDYAGVLKTTLYKIDPDAEWVKANKRPFGFEFNVANGQYRISANSTVYSLKKL